MSYTAVRVIICAVCGADGEYSVSQFVRDRRLTWSRSWSCRYCGDATEEDGWDETPEEIRAELLRVFGVTRVMLDRTETQPSAVQLLGSFRWSGTTTTLAEAAEKVGQLKVDGITGTSAEMDLLADRLHSLGAVICVSRESAHIQ